MTDPTAGRLDEHPRAGADAAGADECLPRGQPDEWQRRSVLVIESGRDVRQVFGRGDDALGVRSCLTREPGHAEHAVADGEVGDAFADLVHDSGDVPPDGERRIAEQGEVAAADRRVHGVHADRGRGEADLAGSGARVVDIMYLEDLRSAGPVLDNDAHCALLVVDVVFLHLLTCQC